MLQALPKTTPEQRAPFYEDIETLLSVGFLSHPVVVSGVHLSLRSLGPGDLFLLRTRLTGHGGIDWKLWTIASSIWMVEGHVLLDDPHAVPFLAQKMRPLRKGSLEILFSLVSGLFVRQTRAGEGVAAYCYETSSRFRWKSYGGYPPYMHSGIPGLERLGSNYVQRMWTFYNEVEDQRLSEDAAWESAKLVTSAQAPKGIKKLDSRDRQARQREQERRQQVQDRFFYTCKGLLDEEGRLPGGTAPLQDPFALKSHEELAQEMYRWVAGVEDAHDRVVNEYKNSVIARHEKEKEARAKRAAEYRRKLDELEIPDRPSPLVGYTQAQLAQILQHRSPGKPGIRQVFDGSGQHGDYVYTKYLERTPDTGGLVATSDGRLVYTGEGEPPSSVTTISPTMER